MSLEIEIDTHELDELRERFSASLQPVMKPIADRLATGLRERLRAGSFAALSQATLSIRKRRGQTGTAPLVATGALEASITAHATGSTATASASGPGAIALQQGFTTSPRSMIPGKQVPARPFALLSGGEADEAVRDIMEFYGV